MKKVLVLSAAIGLVLCVIAPVYAVETEIGGQYRINYYSADRGFKGTETQAAARLRFRPHFNATLNENVKAHLQLEIGHITGLGTDTAHADDAGNVETRHAYLEFNPSPEGNCPLEECTVRAGIIPWSDSFGDTLASSDWNYNPLGIGITGGLAGGKLRVGTYKEKEGVEAPASGKEDDVDLYVVEYDKDLDDSCSLGFSVYRKVDQGGGTKSTQTWYGVRGAGAIAGININGFYLINKGKNPAAKDNSGTAIKLEGKMPVGNANLSVMGLLASGSDDKQSDKFERISDGQGYWGYTGILTIQGPTDTGFDGDQVNPTNNGLGMNTIQAKVDFPIMVRLDGRLAFGTFKADAGTDKKIGTDLLAMAKYDLTGGLAIEFGVDKASLKKGHPNTGGKERDVTAVFARLQAEF